MFYSSKKLVLSAAILSLSVTTMAADQKPSFDSSNNAINQIDVKAYDKLLENPAAMKKAIRSSAGYQPSINDLHDDYQACVNKKMREADKAQGNKADTRIDRFTLCQKEKSAMAKTQPADYKARDKAHIKWAKEEGVRLDKERAEKEKINKEKEAKKIASVRQKEKDIEKGVEALRRELRKLTDEDVKLMNEGKKPRTKVDESLFQYIPYLAVIVKDEKEIPNNPKKKD